MSLPESRSELWKAPSLRLVDFDIRGRVSRLWCNRHPVNAWARSRTHDDLALVILECITDRIWHRGGNMADRYPMAFIRLWRLFNRAPSDKRRRRA